MGFRFVFYWNTVLSQLSSAYRLIRNSFCCFTTWQSLVLQVEGNNGFSTIYLFHIPVLMVGVIVHLVKNGASLAIFFAGSKSSLNFLADMLCCILSQQAAFVISSSSFLAPLWGKRNMPPCIQSECTPMSYNFILWLLNFKKVTEVWGETNRETSGEKKNIKKSNFVSQGNLHEL